MTDDRYDVLIVGGGQGGVETAAALRAGGHAGSIGLIDVQGHLPYSRPPLSKAYLAGAETRDKITLRPAEFWERNRIDLLLGCGVDAVDAVAHTVALATGRVVGYGTLIWAAGGRARPLTVPGADTDGVLTVRTLDDVDRLRSSLPPEARVAIVGGGYIGLEVGASLRQLGHEVTVIEFLPRLLSRVTGDVVASYLQERHERAGVRVLLGEGVQEVMTKDGRVTAVATTGGSTVPADVVVVGVGIVPNVEPLIVAGAAGTNGVDVDRQGRTTLPDVFAIGDCAAVHNDFAGGRVRLESVQNATAQAHVVARVLLGEADAANETVPWFWSDQYDIRLKTAGLLIGHDTAVVRRFGPDKFSVIYLADGSVVAVDAVNAVGDYAQGRALVADHARVLDAAALADPSIPLKAFLPASANRA